MPRGGFRIGAGRPKGSRNKLREEVSSESRRLGVSPLQYLLGVVNDPTASPSRRDRAAIAAARLCHPEPTGPGDRPQAIHATAVDSSWQRLLHPLPDLPDLPPWAAPPLVVLGDDAEPPDDE
jgi:hypothetical protein